MAKSLQFPTFSRIHSVADNDLRLATHKGNFARRTRKPAIGGNRFDIIMMPEVLREKFKMSDDEYFPGEMRRRSKLCVGLKTETVGSAKGGKRAGYTHGLSCPI